MGKELWTFFGNCVNRCFEIWRRKIFIEGPLLCRVLISCLHADCSFCPYLAGVFQSRECVSTFFIIVIFLPLIQGVFGLGAC